MGPISPGMPARPRAVISAMCLFTRDYLEIRIGVLAPRPVRTRQEAATGKLKRFTARAPKALLILMPFSLTA